MGASAVALGLALATAHTCGDARAPVAEPPPPRRLVLAAAMGASVRMYGEPHQFLVGGQLGIAVTPGRNGYLVLTPEVKVLGAVPTLVVPAGFQYEVPLPVANLRVYTRLVAGYAVSFAGNGLFHFGVVSATGGVKYVLDGRFYLGLEPLGFTFSFNDGGSSLAYRLAALGGVGF